MKYLFCVYGGSGSTFLANRFRKRGVWVSVRPDTYFVPMVVGTRGNHKKGSSGFQLLNGYNDFPEQSAADEFYRRSGFEIKTDKPLAGQLKKYIRFAKEKPDTTVMFNYLGVSRFFSQFQISDIVFVIRHPLHNLVSVYDHQHPEKVRSLGGVNTEASVRFFADIWRAMVLDAIDSGNHVIRFEYAREDFAKIPDMPKEIKGLFDSWDSSKRNHGILSKENEQLLYTLVKREYHMLYGVWGI